MPSPVPKFDPITQFIIQPHDFPAGILLDLKEKRYRMTVSDALQTPSVPCGDRFLPAGKKKALSISERAYFWWKLTGSNR